MAEWVGGKGGGAVEGKGEKEEHQECRPGNKKKKKEKKIIGGIPPPRQQEVQCSTNSHIPSLDNFLMILSPPPSFSSTPFHF